MKTKSFIYILFLICLIFLLTGCSPYLKAPIFHQISDKPLDKAVIYIYWPKSEGYRPKRYGGINYISIFTLKANDIEIGTLKHQGYFPYFAEPGKIYLTSKVKFKYGATGILDVATSPKKEIEIDVKAGEEYFIHCTEGFFGTVQPNMLVMSQVNTSSKIKDCILLEKQK